jgi:hypothetical protein
MSTLRSPAFALCLVLVASSPVLAQRSRAERPYRGLFGSDSRGDGSSLVVTGSLSAGVNDTLGTPSADPDSELTAAPNGGFGDVSGGLAYSLSTPAFGFSASGGMTGRYFPDRSGLLRSTDGRVAANAELGARTTVTLAASLNHQPWDFQSLYPGLFGGVQSVPSVPNLDPSLAGENFLTVNGDANLVHRPTRRLSLSAAYSYQDAEYPGDRGRFRASRPGGQIAYQIATGLSLRAGYARSIGEYADGERVTSDLIDGGVDYSRALSFSRRTTFGFSTGSTVTRYRNDETAFRLIGTARLTHEIGRSWTAGLGYNRQVQFNQGLQEPVAYDALNAGIEGLFSRRLQFTSSVNTATGNVGAGTSDNSFDTLYANSRLSYAVSRFLSLGVSYSINRYRFDNAVVIPTGVARAYTAQSIRADIRVWAGLVQSRTRNAAR